MVGGKAAMALQDRIEDEQEVMMNLADILIEIYAVESSILRTEKLVSLRGQEACADYIAMTQIYMSKAVDKINSAAKEAIASFTKGDEQKGNVDGPQALDEDGSSQHQRTQTPSCEYHDRSREVPLLLCLISPQVGVGGGNPPQINKQH